MAPASSSSSSSQLLTESGGGAGGRRLLIQDNSDSSADDPHKNINVDAGSSASCLEEVNCCAICCGVYSSVTAITDCLVGLSDAVSWWRAFADCAPGFTLNGTLGDPTSWCVPCPVGPYCPGGSAQNPLAEPQPCITGLATKVQGAKSSSQCYTVEGFGRTTVALPNGTVTVVAYTCPKGDQLALRLRSC